MRLDNARPVRSSVTMDRLQTLARHICNDRGDTGSEALFQLQQNACRFVRLPSAWKVLHNVQTHTIEHFYVYLHVLIQFSKSPAPHMPDFRTQKSAWTHHIVPETSKAMRPMGKVTPGKLSLCIPRPPFPSLILNLPAALFSLAAWFWISWRPLPEAPPCCGDPQSLARCE